MATLKVREFPGLTKLAPANIEAHETEQALRNAQYNLDVQLHDLRAEFLHRESKLRQEFLDRVAQITAGE
jgi:hypothetical protein